MAFFLLILNHVTACASIVTAKLQSLGPSKVQVVTARDKPMPAHALAEAAGTPKKAKKPDRVFRW